MDPHCGAQEQNDTHQVLQKASPGVQQDFRFPIGDSKYERRIFIESLLPQHENIHSMTGCKQ